MIKNNFKKLFNLTILLIAGAMPYFFTNMAYAADETVKPKPIPCSTLLPCVTEKTQALGGDSIRKFITETFGSIFFKSFLGLSATAAVIFIIVGGFQLHLAMGNAEGIEKARKTITWAVAGLVISILSLAIIRIISNLQF